jgi:hypothetical protein
MLAGGYRAGEALAVSESGSGRGGRIKPPDPALTINAVELVGLVGQLGRLPRRHFLRISRHQAL